MGQKKLKQKRRLEKAINNQIKGQAYDMIKEVCAARGVNFDELGTFDKIKIVNTALNLSQNRVINSLNAEVNKNDN